MLETPKEQRQQTIVWMPSVGPSVYGTRSMQREASRCCASHNVQYRYVHLRPFPPVQNTVQVRT